jgi:hypothetical protein
VVAFEKKTVSNCGLQKWSAKKLIKSIKDSFKNYKEAEMAWFAKVVYPQEPAPRVLLQVHVVAPIVFDDHFGLELAVFGSKVRIRRAWGQGRSP